MTAAPISRRRALRVGGAFVGAAMLLGDRLTGKAAASEHVPGEDPMQSVTSADGTRIAYQRYGDGPPLVPEETTPALLLMGSESPPFLQAATEAVAAALPRGRLAVLPDQGHLAIDLAPDFFLGEVTRFLTALSQT
ncbi:MAG: alpha/beta fold hydrolase [Thermomicrobiales bacterium]